MKGTTRQRGAGAILSSAPCSLLISLGSREEEDGPSQEDELDVHMTSRTRLFATKRS